MSSADAAIRSFCEEVLRQGDNLTQNAIWDMICGEAPLEHWRMEPSKFLLRPTRVRSQFTIFDFLLRNLA